jgi:hypothetical protein
MTFNFFLHIFHVLRGFWTSSKSTAVWTRDTSSCPKPPQTIYGNLFIGGLWKSHKIFCGGLKPPAKQLKNPRNLAFFFCSVSPKVIVFLHHRDKHFAIQKKKDKHLHKRGYKSLTNNICNYKYFSKWSSCLFQERRSIW